VEREVVCAYLLGQFLTAGLEHSVHQLILLVGQQVPADRHAEVNDEDLSGPAAGSAAGLQVDGLRVITALVVLPRIVIKDGSLDAAAPELLSNAEHCQPASVALWLP
jgi:hypothetical protein